MGKASLPLRNLLQGGSGTLELEQTLLDSNDQPTNGLLKMTVTYTPPKSTRSNASAKQDSNLANGTVNQDLATGKLITSIKLKSPTIYS